MEADPVHRYLKSIHNIVIEKGWWRLHTLWGDNVVAFFEQGIKQGVYNIDSPGHQYVHVHCLFLLEIIYYYSDLCLWLWLEFITKELHDLQEKMNISKVQYDAEKLLPSGKAPSYIYALPEKVNHNCIPAGPYS